MADLEAEIEARRQAEASLRESERRYRTLVEAAQEGIWVLDADGVTTFVNPRMAQMLGHAVEEMMGKHLLSFMDDEWRAVGGMYLRRRRRGIRERHDFKFRRKDGSDLWAIISAVPLRDARGRYAGALGMVVDITDRKRAEDELRRANRALRMIGECNEALVRAADEPDLLDRTCRALVTLGGCSRAWVEYAGAGARSGAGPVVEAGPPRGRRRPAHGRAGLAAAVLRTGRLLRRGAALGLPLRADGRALGALCLVREGAGGFDDEDLRLLREMADDLAYGIAALRNVTDRKRAQEALAAERERFVAVLNMLPGFVMLRQAGGRIGFTNRKFRDLFGAVDGRRCFRLIHGRRRPCEHCIGEDILRTGTPIEWEKRDRRGRVYHVWGYPFADADGSQCVLELGIDITERKALEKQILEISSEEQRRIGQDLHDILGQNLTGIAFLSAVLARRLGASGAPEAAEAAKVADLANRAVAQARSLARGLSPVDLTEEGLADALRELAAGVERLFGVRCTFRGDGSVGVQDRTATSHLYRIAQEAVNNAVKHAQPTRIDVTLRRAGSRTVLAVRDDGVGVPEGASRGRGMGLRIMKYRAGLIGASLDIRRQPRGGTRVVCAVPDRRTAGRA